jgi:hypothetical protein
MKYAIYPEKQGAPTASSADANYPVTNLTDNNYRGKVWRAESGVQEATLRVPISANAEVFTLHGTNAETAICAITLDASEQNLNNAAAVDEGGGLVGIPLIGHGYSEDDVDLINGSTNYDGVHILPSQAAGDANKFIITATYTAETFAGTETACVVVESTTHTLETTDYTYDRFWQKYTEQVAAHTATAKLTAGTGETVEAGIPRAGELYEIGHMNISGSEGRKSFNINHPLRAPATYKKRIAPPVRTFNYSMTLKRETMFRKLMRLHDLIDPDPFAMLLADNIDDNMWTVFGSFTQEPSGNPYGKIYTKASVSIEEAG